jgi:hypothetical protein
MRTGLGPSSGYAKIGIADVIATPSAYLVDPKPPPGIRLFVVRYTAKDASISRIVYQPVRERDDPARWVSWQVPN